MSSDFSALTPENFLHAAEAALECKLENFARPFTSYINRVYELRAESGEQFVAKFYRPGRWQLEGLRDEHSFLLELQRADVPVVAPMILSNESTLFPFNDGWFAIFPKRAGRRIELESDELFRRIGSILGRLHLVGKSADAPHRLKLTPQQTTGTYVQELVAQHVPEKFKAPFSQICSTILHLITPLWETLPLQRIHGDFHSGNVLDRLDQGLLVIDFDDMAVGPVAQDILLVLPDRVAQSQKQLDQILSGYEQWAPFPRNQLRLIEALRAMRLIYFTAWCAHQKNDFHFKQHFPQWGSDSFWAAEIRDLSSQIEAIDQSLHGSADGF